VFVQCKQRAQRSHKARQRVSLWEYRCTEPRARMVHAPGSVYSTSVCLLASARHATALLECGRAREGSSTAEVTLSRVDERCHCSEVLLTNMAFVFTRAFRGDQLR